SSAGVARRALRDRARGGGGSGGGARGGAPHQCRARRGLPRSRSGGGGCGAGAGGFDRRGSGPSPPAVGADCDGAAHCRARGWGGMIAPPLYNRVLLLVMLLGIAAYAAAGPAILLAVAAMPVACIGWRLSQRPGSPARLPGSLVNVLLFAAVAFAVYRTASKG